MDSVLRLGRCYQCQCSEGCEVHRYLCAVQPYALACSWLGVHKDSGSASAEAQAVVLASVAVGVQGLREVVGGAVVELGV